MRSTLMIRRPRYVRAPVARRVQYVDPWPARSLFGELDRMLDAVWTDLHRTPRRAAPVAPVSVDSDEQGITLSIGLDGFSADGVEVRLDEHTLVITGDTARSAEAKTETDEPADETADGSEADGETEVPTPRRTFQRSWRLDPDKLQLDAIGARVEEGRLTVRLPRVARPEPRRIPIHRG